jgi:hypothetical protein
LGTYATADRVWNSWVFQYRFALLQAEHACRLGPDGPGYRTSLGAAYYHSGRYREAIETQGGAHRPDTGSPVALAFLAMAHRQFGQHDQARTGLARLRAILDRPRGTKDAEILDLVHEDHALVAPQEMATER